jgi:hypothetical protein
MSERRHLRNFPRPDGFVRAEPRGQENESLWTPANTEQRPGHWRHKVCSSGPVDFGRREIGLLLSCENIHQFNNLFMKRRIIGFDVDDEGHWRAELECGHYQHVRHDPPLSSREWVLTSEGRSEKLGEILECRKCGYLKPVDLSGL